MTSALSTQPEPDQCLFVAELVSQLSYHEQNTSQLCAAMEKALGIVIIKWRLLSELDALHTDGLVAKRINWRQVGTKQIPEYLWRWVDEQTGAA